MEEGLESEEEAEVRDSTPVSTRDLLQGSGEVVVDTVSTRMVEVVVTAHMEVGMEGMAAMATDMASWSRTSALLWWRRIRRWTPSLVRPGAFQSSVYGACSKLWWRQP